MGSAPLPADAMEPLPPGSEIRHRGFRPQGAPGLQIRRLPAMGTALSSGLHLGKGDPAGVVAAFVTAVAAMNSIFSHRSVRAAFQALDGVMGPSPALHPQAAGVMADQVLTVANGIDGGTARVGEDATSEVHGVSPALGSLLWGRFRSATRVKAHCPGAGRQRKLETACSSAHQLARCSRL